MLEQINRWPRTRTSTPLLQGPVPVTRIYLNMEQTDVSKGYKHQRPSRLSLQCSGAGSGHMVLLHLTWKQLRLLSKHPDITRPKTADHTCKPEIWLVGIKRPHKPQSRKITAWLASIYQVAIKIAPGVWRCGGLATQCDAYPGVRRCLTNRTMQWSMSTSRTWVGYPKLAGISGGIDLDCSKVKGCEKFKGNCDQCMKYYWAGNPTVCLPGCSSP